MNKLAKLLAASALVSIGLGGCLAAEAELETGSEQQALDNQPELDELRDFPRGSKVVMAPGYEQDLVDSGILDTAAAGSTTVVYMNRVGGVFSPGQNNAATNRTTLAQQTVNFPPANLNDSEWNQVMSCVQQQFSRFDIDVTDVDPGQTPHYESVVAGSPQLLGMPAGVGGVSPFTSNCDVIPSSIVFTFTDVLPRDPQIICEIAAQEIAHSFGLDHEFLCSDPMTYLSGCGAKSFQDVAAPCGEDQARDCAQPGQYDCGYDQQNSVQLMTQRIGLNPGDADNTVAISSPVDGATVRLGFEVNAAVDTADSVEFRIDGTTIATLNSAPFFFSTPADLAAGTHVLEIIATASGTETSDSISVNLVDDEDGGGSGGGGNGGGGGDGSGGGGGAGGETPQVTGGCQTGGSGSGTAALLLALALFVMRRRKVLS
tara:strand:+ start:41002 stop:42291 length:1290 start_codon:yes stop_codon:yes gene_type:complete